MIRHKSLPNLSYNITAIFLLFILVTFTSCNNSGNAGEEKSPEELLATPSNSTGITLSISSKIPGDLPADASEEDLAKFAWNEFFALNWQADTTLGRGKPLAQGNLTTNGSETAVWETYFHRTELAPKTAFGDTIGAPQYDFKYSINTTKNNITLANHWNVLDEDNEIGSCYLFAYDSLEVLYMAKANLEEFKYLKKLSLKGPGDQIDTLVRKIGKLNGDPAKINILKPLTQTAFCDNDDYFCLPCGQDESEGGYQEGAVEIKTAWRKLVPGTDTFDNYFTKEVVYFTGEEKSLVAHKGTFGLIGLHIIRKTTHFPSFIFASWEHVDVKDAKMKFVLNKGDNPKLMPVVPREISPTIKKVNKVAKGLLSNSVWQNYQLIGVQGQPVDYQQNIAEIDSNYFMANYVIESDSMLTLFHGTFAKPFDSKIKNVVSGGHTFNMGGCQGCHGRAQFSGSDFSFIAGSGVGNERPADPYQTLKEVQEKIDPKLKEFIRTFK